MDNIDFLQTWMRTPNPMLGNAVPIEMMRQGLGTRVAMFIDAAYEASSAPETGTEPFDVTMQDTSKPPVWP